MVYRYTEDEISFVKQNLGKMTVEEMARQLKKTYYSMIYLRRKIKNNFYYKQYRSYKEVYCAFCNTKIVRRVDSHTRSGLSFCNNKCKNVYYSKDIESLSSWNSIINRLITLYGKRCWVNDCGYTKIIRGHHIQFKSNGGPNSHYNCFLCCPNHHEEIHEGLLSENEIEEFRKLFISSVIRRYQ